MQICIINQMQKNNQCCKNQVRNFDFCQYEDQITQSSTPQDFRFMSLIDSKREISRKFMKKKQSLNGQNSVYQESVLQSYHSFTDLMQYEIKSLIEAEKKQEQSDKKKFQIHLHQFSNLINTYFQKMFSVDFGADALKSIFGDQQFTFGSTTIEKTLQIINFHDEKEKENIKKTFIDHKKVQRFLKLIGKDLSIEMNGQLLLIASKIFEAKNEEIDIDFQQIAENCFYENRIKYLNFRFTKTDALNDQLKQSFEEFISGILQLIFKIYELEQQDELYRSFEQDMNLKSLKRFGLYSSKDDLIKSDEENSAQQLFIPRKRNHFVED